MSVSSRRASTSLECWPDEIPLQRHTAQSPGAADSTHFRSSPDSNSIRTAWLRPNPNVVLGIVVGAVVALVTTAGLYDGPIRFEDEGTYVSQALAVLDGRLAPYTYWYDHPPFGWILLAGWMGGPGALFPGPNPIATGRQAMVLVAFLTTIAVVVLVRRLGGGRVTAAAAGLAFGLSPLAIEFHRMVMLDNIAVLFLMVSWVSAATRTRSAASAAFSGMSLAFAVLSKETLLLAAPFVIWMAWRSYAGPTRKICIAALLLPFSMICSLYPIFALLRRELLPGESHVSLLGGVMFQLVSRDPSGSVFDRTSDAYAVASGWFASDWYLLALGALFLLPAIISPKSRPFAAAALFNGLVVFRPGYLPVPYVVVLIPLAAVVAPLGAEQLLKRALSLWRNTSPKRLGRRLASTVTATVTLATLIAAFVLMAQGWTARDAVYLQHDFDQPYRLSTGWLLANTRQSEILVVDNVTWTDMVNGGHRAQDNTVWYTKLNADPEVDVRIDSWRSIDWIVMTETMRNSTLAPAISEALEHSDMVAGWGAGSHRIEVYRVIE